MSDTVIISLLKDLQIKMQEAHKMASRDAARLEDRLGLIIRICEKEEERNASR